MRNDDNAIWRDLVWGLKQLQSKKFEQISENMFVVSNNYGHVVVERDGDGDCLYVCCRGLKAWMYPLKNQMNDSESCAAVISGYIENCFKFLRQQKE